MEPKKRKPRYEPPVAIDLTGMGVNGQDRPLGVCKAGAAPFYSCVQGPDYLGVCTPGTTPDTSICSPGGYHLYPACDPGASAATICISGNGQQ